MMINKLYHTDNMQLMKLMQKKDIRFDLCYADMLFHNSKKSQLQWIDALKDVANDTATLYIHTDQRSACKVKHFAERVGWHFKSWIIWSYNWGGRSQRLWGKKHDDILMFTRDENEWTFNAEGVAIPKKTRFNSDKDWQIPTDVWDIQIVHTTSNEKKEGGGIQTQKPRALMERIIKASSNPNDLVFEPFGGTFTASVVAKELGRRFIACDIEDKCLKVGNSRLT
jgi:site-specific DNA-methyltransferase (adenine-specific)